MQTLLASAATGIVLCLSIACSGAVSAGADTTVSGVYTNAEGNASVQFMAPRPGSGQANGRAHFSLHGVGGECTFTEQARTVLLTCDGRQRSSPSRTMAR